MVIRALYYFLGFFFIVIIILLSQEPYSLELTKEDRVSPTVELLNVKDYNINKDGVSMAISASSAKRFAKKDILYDIDAFSQKNSLVERLRSNNATLENDIIYFDGDVKYVRDDKTTLETQSLEYYKNSGVIMGKKRFEIIDNKTNAFGDSFIYYTKDGKVDAQNIRAIITLEDR